MLTREQKAKVERVAKEFWNSLSTVDKWALGDELVSGDYWWADWMDEKPPVGFWTEVDRLRMAWEEEKS